MFQDHSYAKHVDMREKPFASVVDLSELNRDRAREYFDIFTETVLQTPLRIQIERELQRRTQSIARLAELFDCPAAVLQDMARHYALLHNSFCHTGIVITSQPLTQNDFGTLYLPNGDSVVFTYLDPVSQDHFHGGRFNVLTLPHFMQTPEWAPLRREFAELFLLTMHDHLHDVFCEHVLGISPEIADQIFTTSQPWHQLSLNKRVKSDLGYESFLRQATLAAGCTDRSYLEQIINKIDAIAEGLVGHCTDAKQLRTCQYMLYWMGRYVLPDWDEYEWRLRDAVSDLSGADINKFLKKMNEQYSRENPGDFNRFRKFSADEMQLEMVALTFDLKADVNDFIHKLHPVMPHKPFRPLKLEIAHSRPHCVFGLCS